MQHPAAGLRTARTAPTTPKSPTTPLVKPLDSTVRWGQLPGIDELARSFRLALAATNKSSRTIRGYLEAVRLLEAFLRDRGMPTEVSAIRREHLEAFIEQQLAINKASTANNRYRSLQQFFRFLVDEGEVTESPMARMRPPRIPEDPPPVLSEDTLRKLVRACSGTDLAARRDTAMIRLLIDTGMRAAELAGLNVADVDLDPTRRLCWVLGKGGRRRAVVFGNRTGLAIDRYLRLRSRHRLAQLPDLWLGLSGPLTSNGISQIVRKRARSAGITERVNLHSFRHAFADAWLRSGGTEIDLMRLAGWKSRTMIGRYAASTADARAQEAGRQRAFGDRL